MYQGRSISFLCSFTFINPKFHKGVGGGSPRFLDSGALNIDLRGPKFWYNSYFVITMSVQNVQDLKGVPEKYWSVISEVGVKIQKFKLQKKNWKDILNNVKPNCKAFGVFLVFLDGQKKFFFSNFDFLKKIFKV